MEEMEKKEGVTFFTNGMRDKSDKGGRDILTDDTIEKPKIFTRLKRSVTFGEWPQTIKGNDITITETKDKRGFYLGSDGEYYAKVKANPYYNGYIFSNGAEINKDFFYYFKAEPLKWKIIKEEGNILLIHCDNIIINKAYQSHSYEDDDGDIVTDFNNAPPDTYASNYIYSEIRAWLINEFLPIIENSPNFDPRRIKILPYNISEGNSATLFSDRAFLLSKNEVENANFGVGYKSHMRSVTDYAKANGTYVYGEMSGVRSRASGKGWWWLRTPCHSEGQDTVHAIDQNGVTNYAWIFVNGYGIVPALYIDIGAYNSN